MRCADAPLRNYSLTYSLQSVTSYSLHYWHCLLLWLLVIKLTSMCCCIKICISTISMVNSKWLLLWLPALQLYYVIDCCWILGSLQNVSIYPCRRRVFFHRLHIDWKYVSVYEWRLQIHAKMKIIVGLWVFWHFDTIFWQAISSEKISLQHRMITGVCGQGMSNVFAAPPIKYFVIFFRLSIPNPNRNPNLKP